MIKKDAFYIATCEILASLFEDRNNYSFLSSWLAQSLLIRFVSIHKNPKETEREIFILLFWVRERNISFERVIHWYKVFLSFLSLSPFPYQWEKVFIHHLIHHIDCWLLLVLEIIREQYHKSKRAWWLAIGHSTHTYRRLVEEKIWCSQLWARVWRAYCKPILQLFH